MELNILRCNNFFLHGKKSSYNSIIKSIPLINTTTSRIAPTAIYVMLTVLISLGDNGVPILVLYALPFFVIPTKRKYIPPRRANKGIFSSPYFVQIAVEPQGSTQPLASTGSPISSAVTPPPYFVPIVSLKI